MTYTQRHIGSIVRGYREHTGKIGEIVKVHAPAPFGMWQRVEVQ